MKLAYKLNTINYARTPNATASLKVQVSYKEIYTNLRSF